MDLKPRPIGFSAYRATRQPSARDVPELNNFLCTKAFMALLISP